MKLFLRALLSYSNLKLNGFFCALLNYPIISPLTSEAHNGEDAGVDDSLSHHDPGITGQLSEGPGILNPHQIQLTWQSLTNTITQSALRHEWSQSKH